MARWARRRDRAGRVRAIPNQQAGALERYGVTRAEADRAAWTIEPDGTRLAGAAAINRVLHELGGGWRALAVLYRVPPLAAVEEAFYRWFAARRSRFSRFGVTPACDEPGAGCVG
jgi:predicted DCC family thiol-disulfide oxidoreductase YuxK